ncbi:MAG: phosphotransferase [Clostridiales bacterium]|nr:phosphotransferase [Clostridiales bacterium]
MEAVLEIARRLGIADAAIAEIRSKDGVAVYRVNGAGSSYILKTFEKQADRREIENYRILQSLGVRTIKLLGSTENALLMEDIEQSGTLRLGRENDMDSPAVAARLAEWYRRLHDRGKAYVAAHGQGMYDETDCITLDNMESAAEKTGTADHPVWVLLRENFGVVKAKIASFERTLTYNDFYYTNMIVAKDGSATFMFDYNLLGKGYAYADIRNVTYPLGDAAKEAFLKAYGGFDPEEKLIDEVASPLTTLHSACQRKTFPDWAQEELKHIRDGTLERAIRRLLKR